MVTYDILGMSVVDGFVLAVVVDGDVLVGAPVVACGLIVVVDCGPAVVGLIEVAVIVGCGLVVVVA